MKTLHFDCFAGVSGDMVLGALVDLGVNEDELLTELKKLPLKGWSLNFSREERGGIYGTRAVVNADVKNASSGGGAGHSHEHDGEAPHNSWREIRRMLLESGLREDAKNTALRIFSRIAEAEASVHGVNCEDVCFHEVGAVDSIIDVAGAAVCLGILKPDRITAGPLELGGGSVKCAHGVLSVPVPAVLKLCEGLPVKTGGFNREMTTPTGAGILAVCADSFTQTGAFTHLKTGWGVGARILDKPNVLCVSWREEEAAPGGGSDFITETLYESRAAIDDMSAEELAFLSESLFKAGALDVSLSPCVMKKGRPGTEISALCDIKAFNGVKECFFQKSATLGLRVFKVERISLKRDIHEANTIYGKLRKKSVNRGGMETFKIEYEDRLNFANKKNISLFQADVLLREALRDCGGEKE
ncbi:MAG: nickel pincer cofactor biosynthesis protein LarC [Spirochaetaceae bacterium]|jgi:uncharacterized protein (TIGR00299 family) protein|nr:nickel pincer cofactor biosynthesis protein LarC [Spirochaetaceae bacterium]